MRFPLLPCLFLITCLSFLQGCDLLTEPKATLGVRLFEAADDVSDMESWLVNYVKATADCECRVESNSNKTLLNVEVPRSSVDSVYQALKARSGRELSVLSFHATRDDKSDFAKKVANGDEKIEGYTGMSYRSDPDRYLIVETKPSLDVSDVESAHALFLPGEWAVSVTFTQAGAKKMEAFSQANLRKSVAMVVDGQIIASPIIQSPFSKGCQISANFTQPEAFALARKCNPLPPLLYAVEPMGKPVQ